MFSDNKADMKYKRRNPQLAVHGKRMQSSPLYIFHINTVQPICRLHCSHLILSAALTSFSSYNIPRRAIKTAISATNGNTDENAGLKLSPGSLPSITKKAKHAYQTIRAIMFHTHTALCRLRLLYMKTDTALITPLANSRTNNGSTVMSIFLSCAMCEAYITWPVPIPSGRKLPKGMNIQTHTKMNDNNK